MCLTDIGLNTLYLVVCSQVYRLKFNLIKPPFVRLDASAHENLSIIIMVTLDLKSLYVWRFHNVVVISVVVTSAYAVYQAVFTVILLEDGLETVGIE